MAIEVNKKDILEAISKVLKSKGHFPNAGELAKELYLPIPHVKKCMEVLVKDGYLTRVGNWYGLTYNEDNEEGLKSLSQEKKIPKKENLFSKFFSYEEYQLKFIQYIMFAIGTGAIILSTYYTFIWSKETSPVIFALILSSIMIGFSVFVFESVLLLQSKKKINNLFLKMGVFSILSILWVIVTSFSILSTVAGQYNKNISNLEEKFKKGETLQASLWKNIKEQKFDVKERLKNYKEERKELNSILKDINSLEDTKKNYGLWNSTRWKRRKVNENISKMYKELTIIREKERKWLKSNKGVILDDSSKEVPNFYGWIGKIFKISKDKVQFYMSLFPAVFVDIVAPIAYALALFLGRKDK